ncbi:MAG: ABC transporter permease [Saccharofermentanales bacterium]
MFFLAFLKIFKNKWLFISLSVSIVLFITAASLLPMFNNALLNRMLLMNFNNATEKTGAYSNRCTYSFSIDESAGGGKSSEAYFTDLVENNLIKQYKQSVAYFTKTYRASKIDLLDITFKTSDPVRIDSLTPISFNNPEYNIKIINGRMPSDLITGDGYYEIAVSNDTAQTYGLVINRNYEIVATGDTKKITLKITGIFNPIIGGASTLFDANEISDAVVCDHKVLVKIFEGQKNYVQSIKWDYFLDYTTLNAADMQVIIAADKQQQLDITEMNLSSQNFYAYDGINIINTFASGKQTLTIFILVFTIPMFLLLLFCIFFISKLVVEMDKNEISVLQSRGASITKIAMLYFIQSSILVFIPFFASPFLAVAVCKLLGNTTGFMELGKNISLSTNLSLMVLLFDVAACLIVILTMLIPSLVEARTNIVERKQKTSGNPHVPFWKKFYVDFIMLAISAYGYYNFINRQKTIVSQKLTADQLPIEPLTFFIMVLFLISAGLMFMRFYPGLINIISRIGKKIWSASLYSSLQRVSVLRDKEQFIILFLILTISLGIFSANSARTINNNLDNYILYTGGADMVLKTVPTNENEPDKAEVKPSKTFFTGLEGVKDASIIVTANNPQIFAKMNQNDAPINMIGIETISYSKVAWSRADMLDKPLNYYLNLLGSDPDNCFISKTLADSMSLKVGESFQVNQSARGETFYLKIAAILDTWPSYTYTTDDAGVYSLGNMIIANDYTLEKKFVDVTYNVWMKTGGDLTVESAKIQLFKDFIVLRDIHDYHKDVVNSKNSAERQSLNALLTLSFLVVFAVCFIGFMIYWLLSIQSRILQFGILRAMGMSVRSVYSMLVYEQLFITIITAIYSVFIGGVASRIFVNILKITFGADNQKLPFRFFTTQTDFAKIYIFFSAMFILTFLLITIIIKRIKIAQTIKLGED